MRYRNLAKFGALLPFAFSWLAGQEEGKDAHGLVVSEWAREPLAQAPVALDFDDKGRMYVTQTRRRSTASLDLRRRREWVKYDMSFTTVEERRAFYREKLAIEYSEKNQWLVDFNEDGVSDWKDLTAVSDVVFFLEDTDGDGTADLKGSIDENIKSDVSGIAAGVMHFGDKLYVTAEPDVWMYSDFDGEGIPAKRDLIGTGYQVHIGQGGHNMSGLTMGPDGRLYWSIADKGFSTTNREGVRFHYPNRGAIMRCEPDGSQIEVFALGVRNAQELAFDDYGNLFSVDNDGDYPNERERLLYITEGSEHGWRLNWQWLKMQDFAEEAKLKPYLPWMEEGMFLTHHEGQPAFITPPLENYSNGPCGFVFNPGTALNESLRGCFFLTEFKPTVAFFRMKQSGASFVKEDVGVVEGGMGNTGLAFGPDGALYSAAWVKGYQVLPEGRIFKIDDPQGVEWEARKMTQELLAEGVKGMSIGRLAKLLAYPDQRIRYRAQFELASRGSAGVRALRKAALSHDDLLARLHGIWGIGQLARKDASMLGSLGGLLSDTEVEVRAQMCRVIGDAGAKGFSGRLERLLEDDSLHVRFLASIALGKLEASGAFDSIVEMIVENADADIYLRHAGVMGIAGSSRGDAERLAAFASHESRALRIASVLALRRLESERITAYLNDGDEFIVEEVARAIHDDFGIPGAMNSLAALLERDGWTSEALLRRVINANFRLGTAAHLERVARFAADASENALMRRVALGSLEMWETPGVLDAVEGRYRDLGSRPNSGRERFLESIAGSIDSDTEVGFVQHMARVIGKWGAADLGANLYQWYEYGGEELKWEILKSLMALGDDGLKDIAASAVASSDARLRELARKALGTAGGLSELDMAKTALSSGSLRERQMAIANLTTLRSAEADTLLGEYFISLSRGRSEKGIGLELIEASIARRDNEDLKRPLASLRRANLDEWAVLEYGGDVDRGKALVNGHPVAQCIRCHMLDGAGGNLGPDLREVAQSSDRSFLVESLLYPSASVAHGYGMVSGTLKEGGAFAGVLADETEETILVKNGDGSESSFAKADVETYAYASSMPAMKGLLSPLEVRDIVAFMASLKN